MFTLLKTKEQKEKEVIEQIHKEFDTAEDRLLKEARKILNNYNASYELKAQRLKKLGFVNSELVKLAEQKEIEYNESNENAMRISKYKREFPTLKFLTVQELNRICNEYNLIYAPIGLYLEDVPEKNLKDIENCPYLPSELKPDLDLEIVLYSNYNGNKKFHKMFPNGVIYDYMIPVDWKHMVRSSTRRSLTENFIREVYGIDNISISDCDVTDNYKKGLFIAAPKSHFKIDKDSNVVNNQLVKRRKFFVPEPKDPIVFRYCLGGIQVITKWGKVATDPIFKK